MIYYITGSTGFIGSNIKNYLKTRGCKVMAIRDICDFTHMVHKNEFTVIHCSAYGNHYNQPYLSEMLKSNVLDLRNLTNTIKENDTLVKVYNFSTSSVCLPVQTYYSLTKHIGEKIIEQLNDPRFVNIRPYSVFGEGEADHRFIPTVIRHLQSGETMDLVPNVKHDWIHIEDFINAMFDGYTEIGTGESYSNFEIVKMLEHISGKILYFVVKDNLRGYDCKNWKSPKGVPHKPLFERLKQTYDYYAKRKD